MAKLTLDERARLQRETQARLAADDVHRGGAGGGLGPEQTRMNEELVRQVLQRGGSALHLAAARSRAAEVRTLLREGTDPLQVDSAGDSPLHVAARGRYVDVLAELLPVSNWCTINKAGRSPIDDALYKPAMAFSAGKPAGTALVVRGDACVDPTAVLVRESLASVLREKAPDPSREWAAARALERENCEAMDSIMGMTGLRAVKSEALKLYRLVKTDLKRPLEARIATRSAFNFVFYGNPGTGKTTVARTFGRILKQLGLREGEEFLERTGQELLNDGASKFAKALNTADEEGGGVVFIDEVYQLDPMANAEGRAITNAVLSAAENKRTTMTFIVAGYKEDVQEKWLASNDGLASRFPFTIEFDDFEEAELRSIFLSVVQTSGWRLEAPRAVDGSGDLPRVDVATIAARRLARGAGRKGFANARSVRVLFEQAQRRANDRLVRGGAAAEGDALTLLTLDDVLGPKMRPEDSKALRTLQEMPGLYPVKRGAPGPRQPHTRGGGHAGARPLPSPPISGQPWHRQDIGRQALWRASARARLSQQGGGHRRWCLEDHG